MKQTERFIDQITVVTDDLFRALKVMLEVFQISPWAVTKHDHTTDIGVAAGGSEIEFSELRAAVTMADGVTLRFLQPLTGDTVYKQYLDRFGTGISGIRERIPAEKWEAVLVHYKSHNIAVAQQVKSDMCNIVSLDMMDQLGSVIELIRDDSVDSSEGALPFCKRRFGQLCITSDNVEETARYMNDILQVGPWEIGHANNVTVTEPFASNMDFSSLTEYEFMTGMSVYANFEFELIQPTKGPLPYFKYLDNRRVGFHHVKEIVGQKKWKETLARYMELGIQTYLSGKIGPCVWSNLDTVALLGFVYEIGDGTPMDKLPDGYDAYMYP